MTSNGMGGKRVIIGKVAITMGGDYDASKAYDKLVCVHYNHSSWVSKKPVSEGIVPSKANSAFWQMVADGGDGGVTIVDNLTTGGSANALSAEQGKILKTEMDELAILLDGAVFAFPMPIEYVRGVSADNRDAFNAWFAEWQTFSNKYGSSKVFVRNEVDGVRSQVVYNVASLGNLDDTIDISFTLNPQFVGNIMFLRGFTLSGNESKGELSKTIIFEEYELVSKS